MDNAVETISMGISRILTTYIFHFMKNEDILSLEKVKSIIL